MRSHVQYRYPLRKWITLKGGAATKKGWIGSFQGVLIITAMGWGASVWAQSATTGGLTGTVTDAAGAVSPGVTVALINDATGQTQATTTDAKGIYGFRYFLRGAYRVHFPCKGSKPRQAISIVVNVSGSGVSNAVLEAGAMADHVACQCQFTQAANSSTGTLVNSKTITAAALTTRNFTVLSMSSGSGAAVNNAGLLELAHRA